jgi:hypothetical protein
MASDWSVHTRMHKGTERAQSGQRAHLCMREAIQPRDRKIGGWPFFWGFFGHEQTRAWWKRGGIHVSTLRRSMALM